MSLLCKLFGHIPADGHAHHRGGQYFRAAGGAPDGIGREHWYLTAECRWCGERYQVGMVHGPLESKR